MVGYLDSNVEYFIITNAKASAFRKLPFEIVKNLRLAARIVSLWRTSDTAILQCL